MDKKSKLFFTLTILLCIPSAWTTLSPSDKAKNKPRELKVKTEPADQSVFDRNLIQKEPSAKDILRENAAYYKDTTTKLFNGTVLGYVTPWNNQGYDVAKIFKNKFDIISPVWLQLVPKGDNKYGLAGTHDIDEGWLRELRTANTKIMPRIIFDKFTERDARQLMSHVDYYNAVGKLLAEACTNFKFDGFVVEMWAQFVSVSPREEVLVLIEKIGKALRAVGGKLILVIPPKRPGMEGHFSQRHFRLLYKIVDYFSVMTYDYSSYHRPGANAPLYWMKETVEYIVPDTLENYKEKRSQLLMGLNMYGRDYTPDGGRPIIGQDYLNLLKDYNKRLIHDEHDEENFFEIKRKNTRNTVFYPTLYSINERIKLAREMGVGLALWELGQGLPYFYDLF